MKSRIGVYTVLSAASVMLLGGRFGYSQYSVELTGVNGQYSAGDLSSSTNGPEQVYTGIYYATVDGVSNTGIVCDDFNHNVTIGENWNADGINTSSLSSLNITGLEFGNGVNGQSGAVVYAEVASLVSSMFTLNNGMGTVDGESNITGTDISEAIWYITTKGGITGISANAAALVWDVETDFSSDTSAQALSYLDNLNLWILTPTDDGPQEMWAETVPEGGAALLYLMLSGLTCFGAMFLRPRLQALRHETL